MDGSVAIEANRIALKRIVAMMADMAGLGEPPTSPLMGKVATQSREGVTSTSQPTSDDRYAYAPDSPHSGLLRKPPLPLKGGEEERPAPPPPLPCTFEEAVEESAASRPALPLPRRSGERWPAKRDGVGVDLTRGAVQPEARPHPELHAEGGPRRTIPRLLWRAILALLRPAESATRRLIIAASHGIAIQPPPARPRQPKPQPIEPLLRRLGIAVTLSPGERAPILLRKAGEGDHAQHGGGGAGVHLRISAFPLFDPPRRLALHGQRHNTVPPHAAPRIVVPGLTEPHRLPPPPSPDDPISATRLVHRLAALAAALDDLPAQARRFARWKAARDAQYARNPAAPRRLSPIRRGRPPGGRLSRYDPTITHPPDTREVDEILAYAHSLALHALESPDTS